MNMPRLEGLPKRTGALSFITDLNKYETEKPYKWTGDLDQSKEHMRTNISLESRDDIVFRDVRSLINDNDGLSMRLNGFQILRHPGISDSGIQQESVLKEYVTGLADSIKKAISAELVYCVNFVFRQCTRAMMMDPDETHRKISRAGSAKEPELPAFPAHADYSRAQGFNIVRETLTEAERAQYLDNEYEVWIFNTWSPLYKPVDNAPLAFCHPASLSPEDVIEVDRVKPGQITGVRYLKYKPEHKWHWCSNQTPDEVSIFKSWGSDPNDPLPFVPHGAVRFELDCSANAENMNEVLRDSLETRMVAVVRKTVEDTV